MASSIDSDMKRIALFIATGVLLTVVAGRIASAPWHPPAPARGTAVLELFTSQGCSSCPPADELLSTIGRERSPAVIPLAYHVDYWNSLGWSDPFSSAAWSQRQNEYAAALQSTVYTPQLVVNGRTVLVGSSATAAHAAIDRELQQPATASVAIDRVVHDGTSVRADVRARIDGAVAARGAKVVVVLFENGVTTDVRRGENSGRKLVNDFIVRWESSTLGIDRAGNAAGTIAIPLQPEWNTGHLGIAAFVQATHSPAIYGAASRVVQ
jgi:hypothetical protein